MKSISIKRPIVQHTTLDLCLLCSGELSYFFDLSDKSVVAPFKHTRAHTQCSGVCLGFCVSVFPQHHRPLFVLPGDSLEAWSCQEACWADCSRQDKWSVSRAALLQDPLGLTVDRRWVSACFFTCVCSLHLKRLQK